MEDVLTLYEQPSDPKHPQLCVDERPCQLIEDVLVPLPLEPGKPQREDHEYQRNGTCCLFLAFEPLTGKRILQVRPQRTKEDYAQFLKAVIEEHYPEAEFLRVGQDTLNPHSPAAFYEAFPAAEALALAQRLEPHSTPKQGSWLNMAEIELAALAKQCLDRRIGDMETLAKEVRAWERKRNAIRATVRWSFTLDTAREKFRRYYHQI
jgi:DDE superfamily endonuclease